MDFSYAHEDEQNDAIEAMASKTGWTGSTGPGWMSDTQYDYRYEQRLEIFANVCRSVGHQMVADPEWPEFSECSYCGACNIEWCCEEFYV